MNSPQSLPWTRSCSIQQTQRHMANISAVVLILTQTNYLTHAHTNNTVPEYKHPVQPAYFATIQS